MSEKIDWALNPSNIASIGAIDEFYDLYFQIQEIYEKQKNMYLKNHQYLLPFDWDRITRKDVRKACEPIMNKYLLLFTNEYSKIFANAHGFEQFHFLNWKVIDKNNQQGQLGKIVVSFKSFRDFLVEFQYAVTRIIHKWKSSTLPNLSFQNVSMEVNNHILTYVSQNTKVEITPIGNFSSVSSDVLYVFENLSSTVCYVNKHPIVAGSFTASLAASPGQITFPVHFCSQCGRYFIGEKTLQVFEKKYGKILAVKKKIGNNEGLYDDLNIESRLHQLGYNVSDGRTEQERQSLLKNLLDKGFITYFEMVRSIEWNINNLKHNPDAVEKWKRDLKFIGQCVLDSQKQEK